MNIRLFLGNIADVHVLARIRHDLHNADGTNLTLRLLVQFGFLIAFRHHQQVIHAISIGILTEVLRRLLKPRHAFGRDSLFQHVRRPGVFRSQLIAERSALTVCLDEFVDVGQQLWRVLAYRPTESYTRPNGDVGVNLLVSKRSLKRTTTDPVNRNSHCSALFVAKRDDRIDTHGAPRGSVGRGHGDGCE
jgi:hypothetical protein